MIKFQENVSLRRRNTFGIDITAKYYITVRTIEEARELCWHRFFRNQCRLVLGGGSNILFTKNFEGCVAQIAIKFKQVIYENNYLVHVKCGAGETWHDVVLYALSEGYGGIENLSLIPGTVGAAPIQNIGAYGAELKDVFVSLEAVEISSGDVKLFEKHSCEFGYRDSVFKHSLKGAFVIVSVTLELRKRPHSLNISYGTIRATMKQMNVTVPSIHAVSEAVSYIRQNKLPDPRNVGNAGSFFKNPLVGRSHFLELQKTYPDIPGVDVGLRGVKLSAAWLIESLGWKGRRMGNVGVCETQSLVLVNYGGAVGWDIVQLAEAIQRDILDKFEVSLVTEVNII